MFRFVWFRDVIHVAITFDHVYALHIHTYVYISGVYNVYNLSLMGLSTNVGLLLGCFVLSGFGMLFMLRLRSITCMSFIHVHNSYIHYHVRVYEPGLMGLSTNVVVVRRVSFCLVSGCCSCCDYVRSRICVPSCVLYITCVSVCACVSSSLTGLSTNVGLLMLSCIDVGSAVLS